MPSNKFREGRPVLVQQVLLEQLAVGQIFHGVGMGRLASRLEYALQLSNWHRIIAFQIDASRSKWSQLGRRVGLFFLFCPIDN